MKFNKHWELEGRHSTLSPSGPAWLRYDNDRMLRTYLNNKRKEQGTYLHDLAHRMIITRTKALDINKALNLFVNDAIGYGMESEVMLVANSVAFGTADAIKYDERHKILRVFDLKTGDGKPKPEQLFVYCALFCIEYGYNPNEMTFDCRFYQGTGFTEFKPEPEIIIEIADKIRSLSDTVLGYQEEFGTSLF